MRGLRLLVAIPALLLPPLATAQSIWIGAKVGPDRAAWSGDFGLPSNPFGTRTGAAGGLTVSVLVKDVVGVQLEALYTGKGAAGPDGFRANIAYLEVPLMAKVTLPLGALRVRPMAMVGLAPAWELSCRVMAQPAYIPEAPPPPPQSMDCIGWRTERRDVGAVTAAGVEIPLRRFKVTAEVRRTTGRANIARGYAPLSTYNNVWSYMVGAALPLHR